MQRTTIFLHIIIWLGIWSIFTFSAQPANRPDHFYWISSLRILTFVIFYYSIYYWLLPYYIQGKKRHFYILSSLTFAVFIFISMRIDKQIIHSQMFMNKSEFSDRLPMDFKNRRPVVFLFTPPFFIGLAIFGIAAATRGFSAFEGKKKIADEANRLRLEAEIALLKSQINPHFFLNTLNNLYALSLTDSAKTPGALLKLAEMMNYILNDCAKPKVQLQKDIAFIETYLRLQELRIPPNVKLKVQLPENFSDDCTIEPMILIPFIENAFKYGVSTHKECDISISIQVVGTELKLLVENTIVKSSSRSETSSGMGIKNTQKRLGHSYPSLYTLKTETHGDLYSVELNIQVK